jgi:uncharacterized protein
MADVALLERFRSPCIDARLRWLNEPARWSIGDEGLHIEPEAGTDFWQRTHYGFIADSGHALQAEMHGDLEMTTEVRSEPIHRYDQAGLLVRFSPSCWLKTSVEYEPDGPSRLGVVVTNRGYSDWSTQDVSRERRNAWLRVRRCGSDFRVEASEEGSCWSQLRIAHLDREPSAVAHWGLYACSPGGNGYVATFSFLRLELVTSRAAS